MGYTTIFQGRLEFTSVLSAPALAKLKKFEFADIREHPEWKNPSKAGYYIQFRLCDDFQGIEWDETEKFYDSVECVDLIIAEMQTDFPDFGLRGELYCQGEDYDDRWILRVKDNKAMRVEQPRSGQRVTCPHCGSDFNLE